ncbi:hypothetical protein HDZ31DRAFT_44882 [Schizophyllum fasciatum]
MSLLDAQAALYTAPDTPAVARARQLTRHTLRVTVADGRVFLGQFAGTDRPLNLLLVNAEEYRVQQDGQYEGGGQYDGRFVGQIMIPWKLIIKVEAQGREEAPASGKQTISRGAMDGALYL